MYKTHIELVKDYYKECYEKDFFFPFYFHAGVMILAGISSVLDFYPKYSAVFFAIGLYNCSRRVALEEGWLRGFTEREDFPAEPKERMIEVIKFIKDRRKTRAQS